MDDFDDTIGQWKATKPAFNLAVVTIAVGALGSVAAIVVDSWPMTVGALGCMIGGAGLLRGVQRKRARIIADHESRRPQ